MHRYAKKIIIIFFLIFGGCGSIFPHVIRGEQPIWVLAPPEDTPALYFGVGEGISLSRAKESALSSIAGRLGTYVSETVDRVVSVNGDRMSDEAKVAINTQINKIKLIQPRVVKTAKHDGNTYVLLSVSREATVRDTRSRLKDIDQRLKLQWQALPSLSRLQQFVRTQKLSHQIENAGALSITLQALDFSFDGDPYRVRYNHYRQKRNSLLSGMHFRIRFTKGMRPVAQLLMEMLSEEEIQSTTGKRVGMSSGPVIEIEGNVRRNINFNAKKTHLTTVLLVRDGRGNIVASRKYKVTGDSLNDFTAATRVAVEKLKKQWESQSVLEVIGFSIERLK